MNRLCFALLACAGVLSAADGDVVFRSDVSLVRVDAQVLGRDNRTITGLRAEDFVLREEGRPQQIRNFASENMPIDVLLLLDVSASMRPHVERIVSASHEALRVLRDHDRIAIMVFDRATRVRLPFRNSLDDVERELESLINQENFNGGTDITRAIYDAANYISREGRRDARRAIVILTDDQTERSRDVEGVSRALARADCVLSLLLAPDAMGSYYPGTGGGRRSGGGTWPGGTTGGAPGGTWPGGGSTGGPLGGIILGRRGPYGGRGPGGPTMRGPHTSSAETGEIARRSGGDMMPVDDASALETTLERIRQRYALHFNVPPDAKAGEQRNIEVALADNIRRRYPDADVRYRRVYFAPTGGGGTAVAAAQGSGDTTVGANARTTVDNERPVQRRRPGVTSDGPRTGPIEANADADDQPDATTGRPRLARHVDEPSSQAGPIEPRCGGWHRVDEPAPPPCPSDSGNSQQPPAK
jgi:VWFA-related protein